MGADTIIVSQWYREEMSKDAQILYALWRNALRLFAPGIPILIIHNGGPTDPPYRDIEIIPGVGLIEHERGKFGHLYNCWKSMCYGWEIAAARGFRCGIFISQNLVVGTTFARECSAALKYADVLYNGGCLVPEGAHTEYMALNPSVCRRLFAKEYTNEMPIPEIMVPMWLKQLGLRTAAFPKLHRVRDTPYNPRDTVAHHLPISDFLRFARVRGIALEPAP